MNYDTGQEQIIPLCLNFYISTNRLSLWSVAVILLPLNVFLTVFVLLTHCRLNVTLSLMHQSFVSRLPRGRGFRGHSGAKEKGFNL